MREEGLGRQSQVTEQLGELGRFCDELHKEIELLETRLERVLRGTELTVERDDEEKAPALVGLAQQLSDYTAYVRRASRRISGIYQRLEL